ncbi:aminopeptidase N [Comamonas odontotermitis]
MREGQAHTVYRADYQAPAWWIETVDLTFDLDPAKTRVLNKMRVRRNPDVPAQPLHLNGDELNLARVLVNGAGTSFKMEGSDLVLENLPEGSEPVDLEIFTTCVPEKNTKLMGLYTSNGSFFTQCEAEGFRRITYFLDRPDVMAMYTVTLRASKALFPVLLSNGNLVEQGELPEGRHFAKWVDPHKKPSYLFALVAGNLVAREQKIKSRAGNEHLLQVYVRPGDLEKTEHAMNSLMASIAWDEARFGLSLDLERFMIVATSDFNMGAMENKGLNIFNTKYVLASQATATDADYANIESVVGHEYFHNWTGDRVTCRDWFQLSLKEGLTVFRDQEFSMDMAGSPSARAVKRIDDVRVLRTVQFPEDAGPMAHPVRPDSYVEINNFYTVTVYEKGAEVVRMQSELVGREGFAKGMKLYFERHDGQAVTCDDFAQAMADANPGSPLAQHLAQFKRWYSQSGTPRVAASGTYDASAQTYTLTLSQHCPATAGQPSKEPFVIPVTLGLVGADGSQLPVVIRATEGLSAFANSATSHTVVLTQPTQTIVFEGVAQESTPSLLRNFSAPVVLEMDYSDSQLRHLLAHDADAFNRWEASQRLGLRIALQNIAARANTASADITDSALDANILPTPYIEAMRAVLRDPLLDAAFKDLALTLPSEAYITEQLDSVDPQIVHQVREAMRQQLATDLAADWAWAYEQCSNTGAYAPDAVSSGKRALAGHALLMLCVAARASGDKVWPGKTLQRFKDAGNMTDRYNALSALVVSGSELAPHALQSFHAMFKNDELVMDKWFALQAGAPDVDGSALPAVRALIKLPDFNIKNPNRARSVIFSYCSGNPGGFHRADGAGYAFWAEQVITLDDFNPQVAARLARALDRWKKLAEPYRTAAGEAIAKVAAKPKLSNDVREIITQAMNH